MRKQITRAAKIQRERIIIHCADNDRTVIEEYKLIQEKKSDLSRVDRDYLVEEVAKSQSREVKRQLNNKRRINNLK